MIGKERLNTLAIEITERLEDRELNIVERSKAIVFAHALLKAVEAECEVVAKVISHNSNELSISDESAWGSNCLHHNAELTALPLIEGD